MRQIFYEGENVSLNETENSEKMSAANTEIGSMNETADESENNEMIDEVKKVSLQIPEFMTKKKSKLNEDYQKNEKRNEKRNKRMKKEERLKNRLKLLALMCALLVGALLFIQFYKAFESRRKTAVDVDGKQYAYRKLEWLVGKFENEPTNRDLSWDSEYPEFFQKDIEYLQKHEEISYVEYRYKTYKFSIDITDEELSSLTIGNDYLTNYSLYRSGDSIIVYGECSSMFLRYELNQKYSAAYEPEVITKNVNVPISEKASKVLYWRYNCYLCISENQKEVFVCKDKKVVGEKYVSDVGGLRFVDYQYIADADNNLFMPIIYEDESENLVLDVQKMGNADFGKNDEKLGTFVLSGLYDLPAVKDGLNTKFFVPQNIKSYKRYLDSRFPYDTDTNLGWTEKSLWENFSKIEFTYEYIDASLYVDEEQKGWRVTFYYSLDDDTQATYDYMLDGIDSFVILNQDEPKKYTAYTEEEYWDIVSIIRNIYAGYYTQSY